MLYCIIIELPVNVTGGYYENFNSTGAYGIAIVLAALSVLVLIAMTLLKPKETA